MFFFAPQFYWSNAQPHWKPDTPVQLNVNIKRITYLVIWALQVCAHSPSPFMSQAGRGDVGLIFCHDISWGQLTITHTLEPH